MATATRHSLWQLSPFLIFVGLFSTLHFVYRAMDASAKTGFALMAAIAATAFALMVHSRKERLSDRMAVFVSGTAQPMIIFMVYIFIFSSIFSHVVERIGGIDAAVNLSVSLIPPALLLPGLFVTISLFSLTIGSSMGSIAAFMPIGMGFVEHLGIDPALMAGLVVGGAMLGDNLSLISDTTIAAAQTTGATLRGKFRENAALAFPAFVATAAVLAIQSSISVPEGLLDLPAVTMANFIQIAPYLVVLGLAIAGIDVLAVLVLGALSAAGIGLVQGDFSFIQATAFLFEGFYSQPGMVNVTILVMLIAGLAKVIEHDGGIAALLDRFNKRLSSRRGAECAIGGMVFVINAAIVINTVAILIVGNVAKKLAKAFDVPAKRVACLLDVFSCICQGLVPYTPQLLLAGAMGGVSSVAIVPRVTYLWFLLGVSVFSVVRSR